MHKVARQQHILAILSEHKQINISELASSMQVSVDTIRRDLAALERQGLAQKNHGGATALSLSVMSRKVRSMLLPNIKKSLGKAVAAQIPPGSTLILDAGSTVLEVARELKVPATVITTSLDIAQCLSERPDIRLILLGGEWHAGQRFFAGSATLSLLERYRADIAILGVCALHQQQGISATTETDADIQRLMLKVSDEHWLVTDHLKLDRCEPHWVAYLSQVHRIFINRPWPGMEEQSDIDICIVESE
ncbi:DeoR/GlpR family DNA-binding transcription regulator [Serratia quinivorans]|uniref:DeoR/GlpR family DNA-binding transcription regulator n=1 Tax=Serratia quinivorans TaxID=137545 RepID=UPI002E78A13F|nr:DeoR/GlpR family DNA-binding transcription regulator [Serratia quinivorans]